MDVTLVNLAHSKSKQKSINPENTHEQKSIGTKS